jgi:hypothetical protein
MAYNDIRVKSFQTHGICQVLSLSCKVATNNFSCAFGKKLMVVGWIVDGYVKVFWAKV